MKCKFTPSKVYNFAYCWSKVCVPISLQRGAKFELKLHYNYLIDYTISDIVNYHISKEIAIRDVQVQHVLNSMCHLIRQGTQRIDTHAHRWCESMTDMPHWLWLCTLNYHHPRNIATQFWQLIPINPTLKISPHDMGTTAIHVCAYALMPLYCIYTHMGCSKATCELITVDAALE